MKRKLVKDMDVVELAAYIIECKAERQGDCIVYVGAVGKEGYAEIHAYRSYRGMAHRIVYEAQNGPIPEGLVIDHLCKNRACVNPAHLEAVTVIENYIRSSHHGVQTYLTGICRSGHDLTDPANVYAWHNRKFCRPCNRINAQKRAARRRASQRGSA